MTKNFNFSKPNSTIKTNEKKVAWWEKIWAGLSAITLFGDLLFPKDARNNIPVKWRNMIVLFFLLLIVYLIICGAIVNIQWISSYAKNISFQRSEWFYYTGVLIILFVAMDYFNLDNSIKSNKNQKGMLSSALKSFKSDKPELNIKKPEGPKSHFIFTIMSTCSLLWCVWGLIFYDRILFIILIIVSAIYSILSASMKDTAHVKKVLVLEIITNVSVLTFYLINHFYSIL